jgi:putative FmdB family regulatory protein
MPTYDYHCTACGHQWEQVQSIKADPEHVCPKCHKHKAQRGVGMGAAILVGGNSAEPVGSAEKSKPHTNPVADTKEAKTPAADPTKKPTPATAAGTGAQVEGKAVGAPASAAPPTPAPEGGENTASKATHPAREGRGVGNMRDALARARRNQENFGGRGPSRGGQGGGKNFGAPRKGGSRGR